LLCHARPIRDNSDSHLDFCIKSPRISPYWLRDHLLIDATIHSSIADAIESGEPKHRCNHSGLPTHWHTLGSLLPYIQSQYTTRIPTYTLCCFYPLAPAFPPCPCSFLADERKNNKMRPWTHYRRRQSWILHGCTSAFSLPLLHLIL